MPAPAVSVVLPIYNAVATLRVSLDSIRAQTFTDWELLALDDGSTDGSQEILQEIAAQDHRVRAILGPRQGLVTNLNNGQRLAEGRLIARMDADDVAHPERLAEQSALLEARPDLGVVSSLVEFGGDRERAGGYALHVDWLNSLLEPEAMALNRFVESPLANPSMMCRAELFARHGGYRHGDFPEDYELWLRWFEAGVKMAKVPRVLLTWNDLPSRLTRTDARYDPEAFYRCKTPYLARWLQQHVDRARPIVVWGAGRLTRRRGELLTGHGIAIAGFLDIDPRKVGREYQGRRVWAPDALRGPMRGAFVLGYVAKRDARELTRRHLESCGFVEGRDFLMAA